MGCAASRQRSVCRRVTAVARSSTVGMASFPYLFCRYLYAILDTAYLAVR